MAQLPGGRFTRQGPDAAEFYALRTKIYGPRWRIVRSGTLTQASFGDLILGQEIATEIRLPRITPGDIGKEVAVNNNNNPTSLIVSAQANDRIQDTLGPVLSITLNANERCVLVAIDVHNWVQVSR